MGLLRLVKRGALFVAMSAIVFVAGVSVYLRIEQYKFRRGRLECTLMGYADTGQRWSGWSSHQQPDVKLKQSMLHPNYVVGAFPEWENADTGGSPAVIIWAELSPDANPAEVSRLMQFDLSCLTRLLSCRERDLMPAVWAQSFEDARQSPK